jgi:16S rRNA (guanine527-N7)-methyltransferase
VKHLSQAEFADLTHVSRETLERLALYVDLLRTWQEKINLVSASTLSDVWRRHLLDSAQIAPHIPAEAKILADLGSGAGFPGLVLAIMTGLETHLVESDQRKAAFLREVARQTGTKVHLHVCRIEKAEKIFADVLTARALANLADLLDFSPRFLKRDGVALFLKGKNWREELTDAQKNWIFGFEPVPSRSDPEGILLRLHEVRRAARDPDRAANPLD